jgi:hypothetical protein
VAGFQPQRLSVLEVPLTLPPHKYADPKVILVN